MKRGSADVFTGFLRAQSVPAEEHPVRQKPAVTISRQAGAGALTVAHLVAKQLEVECPGDPPCPWVVFDRNLVEEIANDHHLSKTVATYIVEDARFPLTDAFEALLGLHPSSWTMLEQAESTVKRLAMKGNVILVGRGSSAITTHIPHVLHVRLVAPFQHRVRHFATYNHIPEEQAAHVVRERDEARRRFLRQYFGIDIDDPLNYDLIINTGRTSFHQAARIISDSIRDQVSAGHRESQHARTSHPGSRAR